MSFHSMRVVNWKLLRSSVQDIQFIQQLNALFACILLFIKICCLSSVIKCLTHNGIMQALLVSSPTVACPSWTLRVVGFLRFSPVYPKPGGTWTLGTFWYCLLRIHLVAGSCHVTVSEVLQTALGLVWWWYDRINLSICPRKMVVIPLNKKRAI